MGTNWLAPSPSSCMPLTIAVAEQNLEYRVKAAFLLNFTKFIEFPSSDSAAPGTPFAICVMGEDPFGAALDQLVEGETVSSRQIVVRRIRGDAPGGCGLVYVSKTDRDIAQTLKAIGPGVLTVGEGDSFLDDGGIIAFILENHRVRFNIDRGRRRQIGPETQFAAVERGEVRPMTFARRIRDVSISRKLLVITMITTTTALLMTGIGIVISDSLLFRGYLERELSALARITAQNSTAALAFEDPRSASDTMHALQATPHVVAACIYRISGTVLATYNRPGSAVPCPPLETRTGVYFKSGNLTLALPVMLLNRSVGVLTMLYDLGEISERIRLYGATVLLVLIVSIIVAFFLSSSLREIIARPLAQLVKTTTDVSRTGDYGIRARKFSRDELGALVDAFNEMLARIQTRDLELQRANESLARSNEDLERFAFVASHDLQEPLRMISLFSQLLVRTHSDHVGDETAGYVTNIVAGAKRMRDLLIDLLAYTDIGAASADSVRPVNLNGTLRKVLENLKTSIDESGAVITASCLPSLRVHEGHLISLFQNLISNAIKYRSEAPPVISVSFERRDGLLRFAVADNGIGIAPEYHAKIFVAFKRLHGQNIAGTGIGLAICQRVVARYQGRIYVESRAGEGATFTFTLPEELYAEEEVKRA